MQITTTKSGVVAELNGKYWGRQYEDGHSCVEDFGPITKAELTDPKYCLSPTDFTYRGSPYIRKLNQATLKKVTVTTIYDIED